MTEEEYPVLRVAKEKGQETLERVKSENNLDPRRRIQVKGDELLIPVKEGGDELRGDLKVRDAEGKNTPYEAVKEKLRRETPEWVNADELAGVVEGLEDGEVSELSSVLSS